MQDFSTQEVSLHPADFAIVKDRAADAGITVNNFIIYKLGLSPRPTPVPPVVSTDRRSFVSIHLTSDEIASLEKDARFAMTIRPIAPSILVGLLITHIATR